MFEAPKDPKYDLEDRTARFAADVRSFIRRLPRTITNIEDAKQLVRSSGSVGANYIEANESLSKKDFLHRLRIARKEAKESVYWLKLLDMYGSSNLDEVRLRLCEEGRQIMMILSAIIRKLDFVW